MQIVFKDLDENLIMSRKSSAEWYFDKKMVAGFLNKMPNKKVFVLSKQIILKQ